MKNIIKAIIATFLVSCAVVAVYFIVTLITSTDDVTTAYERMQGDSEVTVSKLKFNLLVKYVEVTGDNEILYTMGISQSTIDNIIKTVEEEADDLEDDDIDVDIEDDDDDNDTDDDDDVVNPGEIEDKILTGGIWDSWQGKIGDITGGGGKWSGSACYICAIYSAAKNLGHVSEDFGNFIAKYVSGAKLTSAGKLTGKTGTVGQTGVVQGEIMPHLGISMGSWNDSEGLNNYPTADGDYIVYYSHSSKHEYKNGSTSNAHWIYVHIEGGKASVANPSKEHSWSAIVGKKCGIRWCTVN